MRYHKKGMPAYGCIPIVAQEKHPTREHTPNTPTIHLTPKKKNL
jgi:hypothetical protein